MREVTAEDLDFHIHGYISLPEVTRASRNYMSLIINGRYIKNFLLNKAIISGYGSKLMVGRFPIVILTIEMDPLLLDVNVHPTKQEVRLSKEASFWGRKFKLDQLSKIDKGEDERLLLGLMMMSL